MQSQTVEPDKIKALFPESVGQGKPLIVNFYSKFCLSCQQLKPKLDEIASENPEITFLRLDVQKPTEQEIAIANAFEVITVPYIVFISGNGEIKKIVRENVEKSELESTVRELTTVK